MHRNKKAAETETLFDLQNLARGGLGVRHSLLPRVAAEKARETPQPELARSGR